MHIISHGLASVLLYRVLEIFAPNLFPSSQIPWYVVAFIFGIIPDLDVLAIKKFKDHHKSPMYWPIIWLVLLISTIIFQNTLSQLWFATIILFSSTILVHICLDYIAGRTAGVQFLFPFSRKEISLCPVNKEKGSFSVRKFFRFKRKNKKEQLLEPPIKLNRKFLVSYLDFYTKNKALFAFELLIILAGLVALIFR